MDRRVVAIYYIDYRFTTRHQRPITSQPWLHGKVNTVHIPNFSCPQTTTIFYPFFLVISSTVRWPAAKNIKLTSNKLLTCVELFFFLILRYEPSCITCSGHGFYYYYFFSNLILNILVTKPDRPEARPGASHMFLTCACASLSGESEIHWNSSLAVQKIGTDEKRKRKKNAVR